VGLIGIEPVIGVLLTLPRLAEDCADQLRLAQTPEAIEAELIGDRVQISQRARLQLGAVEY